MSDYSVRQIARWELGDVAVRESFLQYMLGLRAGISGPTNPQFSFIDLFAGIGGFRKGFEAAGGRCVFTSEWDSYAQKTYRANFGDHEVYGDITKIDAAEIPDHDILVAGFPCQPFSIAGVSKKNSLGRKHGFECETQGTLFFDLERIIAEKQPKAFLLENVKNLVSHDGGRTFQVIKRTLEDKLGYRISPRIVDARSFVPQHRERIFIVGVRPDIAKQFAWDDVDIPDPAKGPRLKSILHSEDGSEAGHPRFLDERGRVLDKYVLSDHLWDYLQRYAKKHQAKGNGFGFGLVGPDDVARTLSARYYKDGSEILVHRRRGNPRRLTPRECARLMGFDQPGQTPFKIVVSDTQAYKQFGNAVAVPVVEAIARTLARVVTSRAAAMVRERKRARGVV
jgi:DNA (cytosine-5)-methyltransferase 1